MEKVRNDKNLPEQTEEFSHPDDWWLDEEDSADGLPVFDPDEAEDYAKDRQRLRGMKHWSDTEVSADQDVN